MPAWDHCRHETSAGINEPVGAGSVHDKTSLGEENSSEGYSSHSCYSNLLLVPGSSCPRSEVYQVWGVDSTWIIDDALETIANVHNQIKIVMKANTSPWGNRLLDQELIDSDILTHF